MSFQGVRHGVIAKHVHDNPEQFYPLFMGGFFVGKPQPKEDLCREILLRLGFSMVEIGRLHACDFNMVEYKRLTEGSTKKKTDEVSREAIKGCPSRASSLPNQTCLSCSLDVHADSYSPSIAASLVFDSDLCHSSSSRKKLSQSASDLRRTGYSDEDASKWDADKLEQIVVEEDDSATSAELPAAASTTGRGHSNAPFDREDPGSPPVRTETSETLSKQDEDDLQFPFD